ncbi:anoctamin-7 [Cynoglossus semilaevis]|uniref:Anoctamin n=1 Tax=Cynoglossus semilaevis TaxID=244447 RepID=A0A3P8WCW3_CYNSE|nr:anoctamin-7 [Cynoglossus semilaevis]XP_008307805.1 anoctamin-7 [Cynoglossus semilaevis]
MRRSGEQREDDNTVLIDMDTGPEKNYGSLTEEAHVQTPDENVFSDRNTRIDFVLVWEETKISEKVEGAGVNSMHVKWRKEFLSRLKRRGLLVEQKKVTKPKKSINFVLLSAPWNVLCYYAEEISLRVPLQIVNYSNITWSEKILSKLSLPNPMTQEVPNPPVCYYTCEFRNNKLERFLGSNDHEVFFKTTQRHQVLYEILARTPYGSVKKGQVGVDRLLSEHIFTAAYPLHEGDYLHPGADVPPQALSVRQILYSYWAKWSCWKCYQPLDHIREYFGEKTALYFAWLGFYTAWLLPASIVGTVVFLTGLWVMVTDVPSKEVCDTSNDYIMCPTCEGCPYWNYSTICVTYKIGVLFDNGGTVFFSVFMSLWAVTFLEYWKRTCSTLSHRWNCSDFEEIEERPRPEFTAMAPMTIRNPVTGAEEPYFPGKKRFQRIISGCMVIIMMIILVVMCLIAIILYRTMVSIFIQKSGLRFISSSAKRIASITASVLNLLIILLLSRLYTALAEILTRWEMHRTQNKYEDMFILKVFVFQFVNFYSSPVYIAFFKGRFVGYPGKFNTLFGIRNEDCAEGGCLTELAQELLVIMVGKQLINNVQEFLVPKLKSWWQKRSLNQKQQGEKKKDGVEKSQSQQQKEITPWEKDYQLLLCEGLLTEYLEMVIQFGFITVFVAACPLAPLFALINNWIEIRLDAQKFVTEYRRPVVERTPDIGIWLPIMQFITQVAVFINAFLIAFTSSFVPRLYYRYTKNRNLEGYVNFTLATAHINFNQQNETSCRYMGFQDENGHYIPEYFELLAIRLTFVIVFEHVVFFIGRFIDLMVPDVPEEVEMKIKREYYMAKAALAENRSMGSFMIPDEQEDYSTSVRHRTPHPSTTNPSVSLPAKVKKTSGENGSLDTH